MAAFSLTARAVADLKEIGHFTQKRWGREQRDRYLTLLDDAFRLLATNPYHGKDCSEIREGYRKSNAGSHVIFYRTISGEKIEVIRILHGSMDIETRLSTT